MASGGECKSGPRARTHSWTNTHTHTPISLCQVSLFCAPPATVNGGAKERQKEGLKEGSVEGTDRGGRRLSRVKASFSGGATVEMVRWEKKEKKLGA